MEDKEIGRVYLNEVLPEAEFVRKSRGFRSITEMVKALVLEQADIERAK